MEDVGNCSKEPWRKHGVRSSGNRRLGEQGAGMEDEHWEVNDMN